MRYYIHAPLEQQDSATVRMRATAYNVESYSGIIIRPGAFRESLPSFVRDGYILYQHDRSILPVGHIVDAVDSDEELMVVAQWYTHADAQALRTIVEERLAAGKGVDVSIGYYVADDDVEYTDGRTIVRRGTLVECSIVLWGDNPEAEVVQGRTMQDHYAAVADVLKAAAFGVHTLARRVRAIKQLRALERRTISKATQERLSSLSQELSRLSDLIVHVRGELDGVLDTRLIRAREELAKYVEQLTHDNNDTQGT